MSLTNKGLLFAFFTVLLWAVDNVFMRYVASEWTVQPVIFSCYVSLTAAISLLIVAGPGKLGLETLKQWHTWGYSASVLITNIVMIYAFTYMTATQTTLLIRFSGILSLGVAWLLLKRTPSKYDLIGSAITGVGCGIIIYNLPNDLKVVGIFFTVILSLLLTTTTTITELHPTSNKAETIKDRCRSNGYVLLVTSFVFMLLAIIGAMAKAYFPPEFQSSLIQSMPSLASFADGPTVFSGMIAGVFIISFATYFYFYSTRLVKTETFLMMAALTPALTYGFEYLASILELVDITVIGKSDFIAGGIIIVGAMYMVYMRHIHEHVPAIKAKRKRVVEAEKEAGNSDYDMLCDTLEFCNGIHKDAAKLLGITLSEVGAVYEAEGSRKFQTTKGMDIGRNYHRNVASANPLTHLSKREVLMKALRGAVNSNESCAVMFIDLDKFKPVNDTYGHEAGNEILQAVAEVLNVSTPNDAVVARVGGDEFVIMLRKPTKQAVTKLKNSIKQRLSTPLQVPAAFEPVQIGASIGIANFPEDASSAKDLMEYADAKMYLDKGEGAI